MSKQTTIIKSFISCTLFPFTLLGTLLAAYWAAMQGVDPAAIIGGSSFIAVMIIALAERWIPFREDWNRSRQDIITDIWHNLLSSYASREIYKVIFHALLASIIVSLSANYGGGLWPQELPLVIDVLLIGFIAEFGNYWVHRISHETDFFWRFHSVHHSPERLYWLNAGRDHPISVLFLYMASSIPLILLGAPAEALVLFFVIEAVHGLFQHCNIKLHLGPLNWLFSMAELHRWHHSQIVKEANHNYGLTFIIWDIVFGTRYLPDTNGPESIGVSHMPNYPTDFLSQMVVPFRWQQLKAEAKLATPPADKA